MITRSIIWRGWVALSVFCACGLATVERKIDLPIDLKVNHWARVPSIIGRIVYESERVTASGELWMVETEQELSDGRGPVAVERFEIRFVDKYENRRTISLSWLQVNEILVSISRLVTSNRQYHVWRATGGYSPARPIAIEISVDVSDRLQTVSEAKGGGSDSVQIQFHLEIEDLARETHREGPSQGRMNSAGRIVLDPRGRPQVVTYVKKTGTTVRTQAGLAAVSAEVPSIEKALDLAQELGKSSSLHFGVDLGPHRFYIGMAMGNQLLPIVPVGFVTQHGREWVAFLAVDQVEAYNLGYLKRDDLWVVPKSVVRFVAGEGAWEAIVDDYVRLRRHLSPEKIFSAEQPVEGTDTLKVVPMSIASLLDSSPALWRITEPPLNSSFEHLVSSRLRLPLRYVVDTGMELEGPAGRQIPSGGLRSFRGSGLKGLCHGFFRALGIQIGPWE